MTDGHLAELLDLDADVLHAFHQEVIDWVAGSLPDRPHIVDLGAGTGVATLALAQRRPDARLTAVDVDEQMLAHLRHKATAAGVADRVRAVAADLDGAWPRIVPADLVWASASLHHLADPATALTRIHALVRTGGLVAVSELMSFPRFLPDGPDAQLEERGHCVLDALRAEAGLHMDERWGDRLAAAGFVVETQRCFVIAIGAPLPAATGRYAEVTLTRMASRLEGRLAADDIAALRALADGVAHQADLVVRTSRTIWLGRRTA